MYTFTCTNVEDHGHCTTADFETADKNSRLHLYIYAGDPVPIIGDRCFVGGLAAMSMLAPVNPPASAPVPSNPLPAVLEHVPSEEGEATANHQDTGADVQPGEGENHLVSLGSGGDSAGTTLAGAQVNELLAAGVGALDSIASLPMVADTEVHEEGTEPAALGVAPLGINTSQEFVNLGDLQVNLSAVDAVALGDGETLLPPEVLGGTTGQ